MLGRLLFVELGSADSIKRCDLRQTPLRGTLDRARFIRILYLLRQ